MARVEISSMPWGTLWDRHGEGQNGTTATLKNLDGTNATTWSAITGGTSSTASLTADASGNLPRFVEGGQYTLDVPALSITGRRVEAVSGSVESGTEPAINANSSVYGALPGIPSDQGIAIQTAIDAAHANYLAGSGPTKVALGPGTYQVNLRTIPSQTQFAAGVWMQEGVTLDLGMGEGTVLQLVTNATLPASAEQGFIVGNAYTAGQFTGRYVLMGGVLDGNGNSQLTSLTPAGGVFNGALVSAFHANRAHRPLVWGTLAKNVWGTSPAPPVGAAAGGESFAFMNYLCEGACYIDCEAHGEDITDSATGWNDTYSIGTSHIGCVAHDFKYGMGFSTYHSGQVSYTNCWAYKCIGSGSAGGGGFNLERCDHVTYSACISGGRLTSRDDLTGTPYGHASAQEKLGNRNGFAISGGYDVTIDASCQSAYNTNRNVFVDVNNVGSAGYIPRVSNRVAIYGTHLHCGQGSDRWSDNVEITAATVTTAAVTGTTTNGSKDVTSVVVSTGTLSPGQSITGTGIPVGTTVSYYDSGTSTLKLSAAATASGAGVSLATIAQVDMFAKCAATNAILGSAVGFTTYGAAAIEEYQGTGGSGMRVISGNASGNSMRWYAGGSGLTGPAMGYNYLQQFHTAGRARRRTAVSNNYTIVASDDIVAVTSTASARTLTLPDGATAGFSASAEYEIVDESQAAGANNITVQRAGTDTFLGGATSKVISTNGAGLRIYWNGTVWVARALTAII